MGVFCVMDLLWVNNFWGEGGRGGDYNLNDVMWFPFEVGGSVSRSDEFAPYLQDIQGSIHVSFHCTATSTVGTHKHRHGGK
jgi:hypothetical protein